MNSDQRWCFWLFSSICKTEVNLQLVQTNISSRRLIIVFQKQMDNFGDKLSSIHAIWFVVPSYIRVYFMYGFTQIFSKRFIVGERLIKPTGAHLIEPLTIGWFCSNNWDSFSALQTFENRCIFEISLTDGLPKRMLVLLCKKHLIENIRRLVFYIQLRTNIWNIKGKS